MKKSKKKAKVKTRVVVKEIHHHHYHTAAPQRDLTQEERDAYARCDTRIGGGR